MKSVKVGTVAIKKGEWDYMQGSIAMIGDEAKLLIAYGSQVEVPVPLENYK